MASMVLDGVLGARGKDLAWQAALSAFVRQAVSDARPPRLQTRF